MAPSPQMPTTEKMIFDARDRLSNFKGKEFRKGQLEAIKSASESDKKVAAIQAPTGSGKSLIGNTVGVINNRSCYLTSTKQLQHQIVKDFPEARHMMGRGNFACNQDLHNRTADLCIHSRTTPCNLKPECLYEIHKQAVLDHPFQILNYHYLLYEANFVGRFTGYPVIICDEADALESLLTGFTELKISSFTLETLDLSLPQYRTPNARDWLGSCQRWAEHTREKVSGRIEVLHKQIMELTPDKKLACGVPFLIQEYKTLKTLFFKLSMFAEHVDDSWIFQEIKKNGNTTGWKFQPTWLSKGLSEQYFFRHGEKFVLMSATLPPKTILAHMLGLETDDIDLIEIDSTYPTDIRPVYLNPVADMGYKKYEEDLPKLLNEIQRLVDKHTNERGIIHTVSYKLNNAIMDMNNPRFITHNSHNKDEVLGQFINSKNKVLVSPSSTRGVDLPDDLCRFIIVAKAPFQGLGDKLVKSRVYGSGSFGRFWYQAQCAQDIVQASGRGVRHKDDYCVTYILDKQAERLIVDNQGLFPRYWLKAVDYI